MVKMKGKRALYRGSQAGECLMTHTHTQGKYTRYNPKTVVDPAHKWLKCCRLNCCETKPLCTQEEDFRYPIGCFILLNTVYFYANDPSHLRAHHRLLRAQIITEEHRTRCKDPWGMQYSWIGRPIWADKKLIYRRTRRVTTIPRPPLESSRRGEFRSSGSIFV